MDNKRITVQVAQQFVGINTVMYYSPTIVQLAGYASNKTALGLSLITSGLNALGSIVSMVTVDRYGRRRLMILSMIGIIVCLVALSVVFFQASVHSPPISRFESTRFGGNSTCSSYLSTQDASSWSCTKCLKAASDSAFCANSPNKQGFMASDNTNYEYWSLVETGFVEPASGVVMTEAQRKTLEDQRLKDLKTKNYLFQAIDRAILETILQKDTSKQIWDSLKKKYQEGESVNDYFARTLTRMTSHLPEERTFLLFAGFSFLGLIAIFFLVPETKGLPFEEVEKMLEKGYRPSICSKQKDVDPA
ncbi:unnamed protein product [Camellia sinensis]